MLFEGGALPEYTSVPRCYKWCKVGPDSDADCVQFCLKIDDTLAGFCKKGLCCCVKN